MSTGLSPDLKTLENALLTPFSTAFSKRSKMPILPPSPRCPGSTREARDVVRAEPARVSLVGGSVPAAQVRHCDVFRTGTVRPGRNEEKLRDPGASELLTPLVREGGVEPPLHFWNTDLNRARLPIPPLARAQKQYEAGASHVKPGSCGVGRGRPEVGTWWGPGTPWACARTAVCTVRPGVQPWRGVHRGVPREGACRRSDGSGCGAECVAGRFGRVRVVERWTSHREVAIYPHRSVRSPPLGAAAAAAAGAGAGTGADAGVGLVLAAAAGTGVRTGAGAGGACAGTAALVCREVERGPVAALVCREVERGPVAALVCRSQGSGPLRRDRGPGTDRGSPPPPRPPPERRPPP